MPDRLTRLTTRLSGGPRLVLAVLLLVVGAVAALAAGTPPPRGPVVVTARDLPAGRTLVADDVRLVSRPVGDRPARAVVAVTAARGARLAGAMTSGEVLTAARLVPSGFPPLAADRRRVAVAVGATTAAAVAVGDTVDVTVRRGDSGIAAPVPADTDPTTAAVLARGAAVLAVWPAGSTSDPCTVLLAVDAAAAGEVSVLTGADVVGLVRDGP